MTFSERIQISVLHQQLLKRFLVRLSDHYVVVFRPDHQFFEGWIGGEHPAYLRIIGKGVQQYLFSMGEQGGTSLNGLEELEPPCRGFRIDDEFEFFYAMEYLRRGGATPDEGGFGDSISFLAQGNPDLVQEQPSFQGFPFDGYQEKFCR